MRISVPPAVSFTLPLPLITPGTVTLMFKGVAKSNGTGVLFTTLPTSEPGLVEPSPTCSVPLLIVVTPVKLLFVLVKTTTPLVAGLLTTRPVGPPLLASAEATVNVPPPPPRR